MTTKDEKKQITLTEADITSSNQVGRRSALGVIGATIVGAAATAVMGRSSIARAQTDSDSGPGADRAGQGRTGATDSDSGPAADRGGHGRGGRGGSGVTDSDSGPGADTSGHGRTGRSDSDSGPNADRGGHGRH